MNILEQSCKTNTSLQRKRVTILCDKNGFARMKEFLHDELTDSLVYLDDNITKIEDIFVFTEEEAYIISCDDYIFINLINFILCSHMAKPIKNIPSVFYKVFFDERNKDIIDEVHNICNIDSEILKDAIDDNDYEILHDVNWFDVPEESRNKHLFIDLEIITTMTISKRIERMFYGVTYYSDYELDYSYIRPDDLKENSKEYKLWNSFVAKATQLKYELKNMGLSYETSRDVIPGCAARQIKIAADMSTWQHFFDLIDKEKLYVVGPNERRFSRMMAEFMLEYAFTDEFRELLLKIMQDVDSYDELPF